MTKIYCLRQKKFTETDNEKVVQLTNGRLRLTGTCVECGSNKSKFISSKQQSGEGFVDVLMGVAGKTLYKLGKRGIKRGLQNNAIQHAAASYIKNTAGKMIDRGTSEVLNDLASKINTGGTLDIHKAILKVAPKQGFVLPGHHYTGPGNPLDKQVNWDNKGNILEVYQKPTGKQMLLACNTMLIIQYVRMILNVKIRQIRRWLNH